MNRATGNRFTRKDMRLLLTLVEPAAIALENAILDYAGCVLVISHDRWFLDRVCTHILAFEGDSRVVWFEGNYQEYEEDRRARLGEEALQPHRLKYRKLVRD